MNSPTRQILQSLEPYWDRIAHRPLSPTAVERLENAVGIALPSPLRDFLMTVGLFQDLTQSGNNAVLLFESVAEYSAARRDLLDGLYGEVDMLLLPFGHNGSGDLFALLPKGEDEADIYFLSQTHATAEATGILFTRWLDEVVRDTLAHIDIRVPNEQVSWRVQFSFRGSAFDHILDAIRKVGEVRMLDADWIFAETSPTGVKKSTLRIGLDDTPLLFKRLEYPHWTSLWYFVDVDEPLDVDPGSSIIQRLDDAFHDNLPGHNLILYGARKAN